jgi:Uma2 family endonuclease
MKNENNHIEKKESPLDRAIRFQVMLEEFRGKKIPSDENIHQIMGQFFQTLSNELNESTKNLTTLGVFVKIKSWLKEIHTTQAETLPTKEIEGIRQGEWTYEDYLHLPDDNHRYEIIEGVLYVSETFDADHQTTINKIVYQMKQFVIQNQLGDVFIEPFEIHLAKNIRPVQPDVLFIKAEKWSAKSKKYFEGSPDLVVEVLSPNTRRVDQFIKFGTYEKAQIPEYWMVDPKARLVQVYILDNQQYVLLDDFMGDEMIESKVLSGFKITAASLFVQDKKV